MFPFEHILPLLLSSIASIFFEPLFWVVVLLVALQYRRTAAVKESLFGVKTRSLWFDTLLATGYGVIGGLAGSLLIILVGLTLSGSSLIYLWPVAILFMLINPRFLCFAYAGGLLALTNILFGFPSLNVAHILALVAILHMVESMLILISGHLGAVPGYFKNMHGRVVGGFTLQKFWPIPIVVLVVAGYALTPEGINMPDWWPLLKPAGVENLENVVYSMIPVVAGLGYGDLAIARNPWQKSRLSALYLGLYSIILLLFSFFAQGSRFVALVAALFSPLGHEMVIYVGKKLEFSGPSVYIPSPQGVRVLDTIFGAPAWKAGIRSGDLILSVAGQRVFNQAGLQVSLTDGSGPVEVEFLHGKKQVYRREVTPAVRAARFFGILAVPEGSEEVYLELSNSGPLGKWWGDFWKRFKH
jgi:hypothetical protein